MVIVVDTFKPKVSELIGNLHLDSVEEACEKNMHARCASIKDDSSLLNTVQATSVLTKASE